MIQGLPPHKCKAAQAREDEQNRADERARQAKVHAEKKGSKKGSKTSVSAAPSASDDSQHRKRDRTMAMPSVPGRLPGGAGGQKKARSGHYDRDGFLIPEDIPLAELELVEVQVNGLPRVVPTIAITKEQVRMCIPFSSEVTGERNSKCQMELFIT